LAIVGGDHHDHGLGIELADVPNLPHYGVSRIFPSLTDAIHGLQIPVFGPLASGNGYPLGRGGILFEAGRVRKQDGEGCPFTRRDEVQLSEG